MSESKRHYEKMASVTKPASFRGRRKWRKPKDKPKPPLSAYEIFVRQQTSLMQPSSSSSAISSLPTGIPAGMEIDSRHMSVVWKGLDQETRSLYEMEAKKDQQRFAKEIEEWQSRKFQLGSEECDDQQELLASSVARDSNLAIDERGAADRATSEQAVEWDSLEVGSNQAKEQTRKYVVGIEEWRQSKRKWTTKISQDHLEMLSAAFPSMSKFESGLNSAGDSVPMEGGNTAWQAMPAEHCFSKSPPSKPLGVGGPELAAIPSPPPKSSRVPSTSGASLASASASRDLPSEQVEKYVRPENLTHLVAQLEHEEVEFLASLRHAR